MATIVYNEAKKSLLNNTINWTSHTIKALLLMSDTTADTQMDGIANVDDITILDECDDTGYARVTLAGKTNVVDDTNDRAVLDADDISFAGLNGDSSRDILGLLLIKHVDGTAANDIPLVFIQFADPLPSSVSIQFDIPWNSAGILQLRQAA